MTYEQVLAKLNLYESDYFDYPNKELLALHAVVEMCKPSDLDGDDNFYWKKALLETIGRELS